MAQWIRSRVEAGDLVPCCVKVLEETLIGNIREQRQIENELATK